MKLRTWKAYAAFAATIVTTFFLGAVILLNMDRSGYFTEYAAGFSESGFDEISVGDSSSVVLDKLGPPLRQTEAGYPITYIYLPENIEEVVDQNGKVLEVRDPNGILKRNGIKDYSYTTMKENFGSADVVVPAFNRVAWHYTKYNLHRNHQQRILVIDLDSDTVVEKIARLHVGPRN